MQLYTVYFIRKLLYIFRVVSPPIIRITNNRTASCTSQPLLPSVAIVEDGWRNHPKHVEQFTDKINCVNLHLVGHLLTKNCDKRSHENK